MVNAIRVYWHAPEPIFQARVNLASPTYPIANITYDNVTTGAYTDLGADMLITLGSAAGLDDYGRGRLRQAPTATTLKVGRSSQGTEDGQLEVVDNAYISVYEDYRVWSKIPVIGPAPNYVEYKDTDIPVSDRTEEPPPIANLGSDFAGSVDPSTDTLTVFFAGSNSMAVADGATIASYAWEAPGGTFVNGTDATDADVYIEFEAGAHWVRLTVTDSNGKTNTGHRFVLADDPDDSLCVSGMQVQTITRTQQGSTARLRVLEDLPRADYPDGAKVIIWEDRPSLDGVSRDHMLFVGWHQTDQASSLALETHLRRETQLTCVDVAGRMDSLPGFAQRLEVPDEEEGLTWGEMPAANMDKFLHYLIQWHSTAAQVADFYPSGTWDEYPFVLFDSAGATLYEQLQRQANRIVPDHNFTCDRFGNLRVVVDPMLQNTDDRTATIQNSLTESAWSEIDFGYQRPPRVHTLRGSALLTQEEWEIDDDDEKQLLTPVFAIAPGTAPGQGGREQTLGERLAQSQEDLNDCVGHHYARLNARYSPINVTLNLNADPWDFDPAAHTWVQLLTSAATAPQRGLDFETIRCLCKEVAVDFSYSAEAVTWRGRVVLELETVGLPALTEEQEEALPVGEEPVPPAPWTPPDFGDPEVYFGDMQGYVFWNGTRIFRTANLLADFPTWQIINSGMDGIVQDCQYVMVSDNTVGAWAMTTTAIWWCGDIQAVVPVWEEMLPIETVRAADATPEDGDVVFKCMFHAWTVPGHLCVATGPLAFDGENTGYEHAYFWVTEDGGNNWTQVDMNGYLLTNSGATRGYCYASLYGMNIYRSSPNTIYCIRATPRVGLVSRTTVFLSSDLGYTWTKGVDLETTLDNFLQVFSLLNPFPDVDDPSYAVTGTVGVSIRPYLWVSTNEWSTATQLTDNGTPTGYGGVSALWRPNKRTFDNSHVMAWFRHTDNFEMHLLESNDGGSTWDLLYDSGIDQANIDNTGTDPAGTVGWAAAHNTPNGWPPDVDQWVMLRASATIGQDLIQLTVDNFDNLIDKKGNLRTLVSSWTNAPTDGFALPKVGANAETPSAGIQVRVARSTEAQDSPTVTVSAADVEEGDTVILHLRMLADAAPSAVPSGFTLISNGEITGANNIRIYTKVATGSEPSDYSFTFPSSSARLGLVAIYSGSGSLALDASDNQSNTTSTTYTAPAVTTTVPNTMLINFYSINNAVSAVVQPGMQKLYDTGGSSTVAAQYQIVAAPGATGTRTMTSGSGQTSRAVSAAWKEV